MKTKLASALLVLAAGSLALGASAQTPAPSPAPAVEPAAAPAPSRIIYAPRLPSATELTSVAAAQGISVERIDQTATQIVVTYKAANGQLITVSYQLLANVATPSTPAPVVTTVVTPAPTRTVVYAEPYPYMYDPFYNPWGYYAPVAVSFGLGYYWGGHGGYYHGHGHHHW